MLPSLQVGDHIVATPYRFSAPQRGDVVVFHAPADPSELMVKRIIAIPGDVLDTQGGRVRIGEHTIAEPYLLKQAVTGTIDAQVIPHDSFFVMGDNREDSLDSRRWGPLPQSLVVGRVRLILWSSGGGEGDHVAGATTVLHHDRGIATALQLSRIFKCVR
jgi:signal peptidase I